MSATKRIIALTTISEERDGQEYKFHNGSIFETTAEKAQYYIESGYARVPQPEEEDSPASHRQSVPVAAASATSVGGKRSYIRRDVAARK